MKRPMRETFYLSDRNNANVVRMANFFKRSSVRPCHMPDPGYGRTSV
jgi:hypothetical protein